MTADPPASDPLVRPLEPDPDGADRAADAERLARAIEGDQRAFQDLYERHRRAVFKVAYGLTRNVEDALDVVQETFIKAHKSIHRFERRASVGTWLCQIAVHQAIDMGRRRKVRQAEQLDEMRQAGGQLGPAAQASERELTQALEKALAQLSDKHRAVFVLAAIKGLSYKEIAQAVGCSLGTVMSRLFYARKRLQGLLAEYAKQDAR